MQDIIGRIKIDGSGIQAGLNQAKSGIDRWAGGVKGTIATIFSSAAFVSAIRKTIAEIDQISDVSEEFDVPVEQVQALKIAATEASDSFDKLLAILTKIQDIQIDIVKGDTAGGMKNRQLLQRHGIGVNDINNMSVTEFAKVIANTINNKAELNQLLGPRMAGKFELYRGNLQNLDENVAKGVASGRINSKDTLDEFNKEIAKGKEAWGNAWNYVTNSLFIIGNILQKLITFFSNLFENIPGLKFKESILSYNLKQARRMGLIAPAKSGDDILDKHDPLVSDIGNQQLHTDALLSVGNFLGQGFNKMSTVTTLVEETKKQTEILKDIAKNTDYTKFGKMLRGAPELDWPFPPILGKAFIQFFHDLGKGWEQ